MSYGANNPSGVPLGLPSIVSLGLAPLVNPYPALDLDFINNQTLDSRVTFSRGSQATLFDSTGTLVYANSNVLLYSEDFGNVAWGAVNASVSTNVTTAPNGTATADKLIENSATSTHIISYSNVPVNSGAACTVSIYAKASERQFLQIRCGASSQFSAIFNLLTGAVTSIVGSTTAVATSVGNDWWRLSISFAADSAALSIRYGLATDATTTNYAGNGASGAFIWGAQVNLGSTVGAYVQTVASAYYAPRFDYNPSTLQPLGLLIEEARTNNALYSADFADAAWTKGNSSITSNAIVAPDGTLTADLLIGNGASSTHGVQNTTALSFSAVANTLSVFAKAGTNNFIQLRFFGVLGGAFANFDLANGVVGTSGNGGSGVIQSVGNGWYRCAMTAITSASASGGFNFLLVTSASAAGNETNTLSTNVYIWGAQLEVGAFVTSYIPTTTTALTRNADVASMTGTNFSSWYNASEGTLYAEPAIVAPRTSDFTVLRVDDGTSSNRLQTGSGSSATIFNSFIINSGASQGNNIVSVSPVGTRKLAFAYGANSSVTSASGSVGTTDTTVSVPAGVNRLLIGRDDTAGYINGWIGRVTYYPTHLPNSTLQALTA